MDDGKLAEFATVTGCADADKARFFLESAAGDVAAAVEAFCEHGDGEGAPGSEDPAPGSGAPEAPGAAPVAASVASPAARPPRSTRAAAKGNVRGFGDLGGADVDHRMPSIGNALPSSTNEPLAATQSILEALLPPPPPPDDEPPPCPPPPPPPPPDPSPPPPTPVEGPHPPALELLGGGVLASVESLVVAALPGTQPTRSELRILSALLGAALLALLFCGVRGLARLAGRAATGSARRRWAASRGEDTRASADDLGLAPARSSAMNAMKQGGRCGSGGGSRASGAARPTRRGRELVPVTEPLEDGEESD